jgi:large subunit ribosomal protein L32
MPVPKRRVSKTRKRQRRAHWKIAAPGLVNCPQCGYYKNRKVIETE